MLATAAFAEPTRPYISVTADGTRPAITDALPEAAPEATPKLEGPPLSITQRYVPKQRAIAASQRLLIEDTSDDVAASIPAPAADASPRLRPTKPTITVSVLATPPG